MGLDESWSALIGLIALLLYLTKKLVLNIIFLTSLNINAFSEYILFISYINHLIEFLNF